MKTTLILTTANLSTNPRLVKEIDLLSRYDQLIVIIFKLGNWSDPISQEMISQRPNVQFIQLDSTRNNFFIWLSWAIIEKVSRLFWSSVKSNLLITALAHSRRSLMLRKEAIKIKIHPKRIIAHNLGALYPAYWLAKKWRIPFHYDIEDYDPGIIVQNAGKNHKLISENLLKHCLPFASSLTSASSLIGQYTLDLIGGHLNHTVVHNSFPSKEFRTPISRDDGILKMVWFSQKISFGRGLEQLFEGCIKIQSQFFNKLDYLKEISITLIGDLDPLFEKKVIQPAIQKLNTIFISVKPALPQKELHASLANYNIGLALEIGKDINNNLAISNKIMAYAQAGLYILATDTPAQTQFIKEDNSRGILCGQTANEICFAMESLITNKQIISLENPMRYSNGQNISWEKECEKIKLIYIPKTAGQQQLPRS